MLTFRPVAAAIAAACALFCALAAARAANPTANAGADQTVIYAALPALVTLSGSGVDPDAGAITAYSWTTVDVPPGSAATLSSAVIAGPTFTADVVGTYRFCLRVTDDQAETNGTDFLAQPTAACTNVMATTANLALVKPAKGQRNTWDLVNAWAAALDTLKGDFDAFVALIASDAPGAEGADEVGTDTKVNLNNATTVEVALTYLDSILTTVGPYLPLAGGTMSGDVLLSGDNTLDVGSAAAALAQIWARIVDSSGALAIAGTTATSLAVGRVGIAVGILGTVTITGAATWGADNTYALGSATVAASAIYSRIVSSSSTLTMQGATGASTVQGLATYVRGGTGGAGTGGVAGGDGATLYLDGGTPGADGGAGPGSEGEICVACSIGQLITLGNGSTFVDIQGTPQINGASVTASALELNQVCDGVGLTVTTTNLDTLTDGSDAGALHSHAGTYLPLAGGTLSGDVLWSTDNARDLGSTTNGARAIYANTLNNSTQVLTVSSRDGAATVASQEVHVESGAGGASDGVSVGATAGALRFTGGQGGAGSAAIAAGTGATFYLSSGRGGTGTATVTGGTGGALYVNAGAGGVTGGAGVGTAGTLYLGTVAGAAVNIGKAGVTTTIAGTVDLPSTWQIATTTVNATAANLNTLVAGTSSNADALHRHAVPVEIVGGRSGQTTVTTASESATIAYWSIPDSAVTPITTIRCVGACATSGTNDAVCSLRWKDSSGAAVDTEDIPDGECGDGGTALATAAHFDISFASSDFGAAEFGTWHFVADAEGGNCYFAGITCWAY